MIFDYNSDNHSNNHQDTEALKKALEEAQAKISELKEENEKLKIKYAEAEDARYELSLIIDSLPVYLFVKDIDNDFRYLVWNKAFEEYSKIPKEKVIGNTDFEIFPQYEDAVKFRNDDLNLQRNGGPISFHETYEAADGKARICQTIKCISKREGKSPILIGLSWDITNLSDVDKELVEERLRAEKADRLKSAFLANMSHEIRTPLNAIVGFSELLTCAESEDDKQLYSDIIKQNSDTLLQLINDILDISKIEAGTLEYNKTHIDLNELFNNIYEANKARPNEGVKLVYDNAKNTQLVINEDPNRLMQVVVNLINNAIKFTHEGAITYGYEIKDGYIEVYVNDTGTGIPEDKVDKVFDRFVKLDNYAKGTGLGLAICRLIINLIGGKIWVESEYGKGSTFRFTIPYDAVKDAKRELPKPEKEPVATNTEENHEEKKTILVAEDNSSNFLLINVLLRNNYNILWAHDGEEAIKMFKANNPDLILMDVKMPHIDGLEATRLIRTYSAEIPIVILTAHAFEADKQKAIKAGATKFLTKPLNAKELRATLATLLP